MLYKLVSWWFNSPRRFAGLGFAICVSLLLFAFYLESYQGLDPCPLCMAQRFAFVLVALVFLFYSFKSASTPIKLAYPAALLGTCGFGIYLAGRHVWIQSLPADKVPACGPDFYFLFEAYPATQAIKTMLMGSGNCASIDWRFLSLSIPQWTLLFFVALLVWGLAGFAYLWTQQKSHSPVN
ncbi:MAG TPA: disulfide bond formation protein B [Gammaproteobacteria bacterium]|nr:disulfide bond formation protein B [Gammaproteobacteria bacterium]